MTEPNFSTTSRQSRAAVAAPRTHEIQACDNPPSELRPAGSIGASSNTELSTASPATPEANGYLGPSWRRAPPQSLGTMNLERPDAAITARGASSAYIAFGLPYPSRHETPSFKASVTHPRMWGTVTSTPSGYIKPGATHRCSPEMHSFEANLKHRNTEPMNPWTKAVTSTPSNIAGREASRAAQTGASSVAGPSQVVTTVTHTPQRTMSASEIFKEVRECVVEYLGSDVER